MDWTDTIMTGEEITQAYEEESSMMAVAMRQAQITWGKACIKERKRIGEWLYDRKVPSGDNWYMSASPVRDTANLEITKGELDALKRGELLKGA